MDPKTEREVIAELVAILVESESLGLTFERGRATILASYVEKQEKLRARITVALRNAAPYLPDLELGNE